MDEQDPVDLKVTKEVPNVPVGDVDDLRTALSRFDGDVEVVIRLPGEEFRVEGIAFVEAVEHEGRLVAVIY
jgi:hypothetical protein